MTRAFDLFGLLNLAFVINKVLIIWFCQFFLIFKNTLALTGVAQLVGHGSAKGKAVSLIPSQD